MCSVLGHFVHDLLCIYTYCILTHQNNVKRVCVCVFFTGWTRSRLPPCVCRSCGLCPTCTHRASSTGTSRVTPSSWPATAGWALIINVCCVCACACMMLALGLETSVATLVHLDSTHTHTRTHWPSPWASLSPLVNSECQKHVVVNYHSCHSN